MGFLNNFKASVKIILSDIGEGFFLITHNVLALLGLFVFCVLIMFSMQSELRDNMEAQFIEWLQNEHGLDFGFTEDDNAIDRVTAIDPQDLSKEQSAVVFWLSRKYRIAPEPLSALVVEAYNFGQEKKLDPTLILAVMAVESGFNPFAQSSMGAQGLMQVITSLQTKKYDSFGGKFTAFDPITNLRVGATVLRENIDRKGSIESGLLQYVGAGNSGEDGGYVAKVLAEQQRLRYIASGQSVSNSSAISTDQDGPIGSGLQEKK